MISNYRPYCKKCGGTMLGDGYSTVMHCEFAEVPDDIEPDAEPILCDFEDDDHDRSERL